MKNLPKSPWSWSSRHLSAALLASGCTLSIDVERYEFGAVDAGADRPLPLRPDAGLEPAPPPSPMPSDVTVPPPDAEAPPAPSVPVVEAPPIVLPRPVALGEPGPVIVLAGNPMGGGAQAADCPGGVLAGLYFRYFTDTGTFPSRLSLVAPICGTVEPGTPVLPFGELTDARWLNLTTGESSTLPPLRDTEQEARLVCPGDEVLVGSSATFDDPVGVSVAFRTLSVSCATLGSDTERATVEHGTARVLAAPGLSGAAGAVTVNQPCPAGTAASAIELRSGSWLDSYGLRCSRVSWPFVAGHACASGAECQSGVCGAMATCEP